MIFDSDTDTEAMMPISYVVMVGKATADVAYNHRARVTSIRFPDHTVVTHQPTERRRRRQSWTSYSLPRYWLPDSALYPHVFLLPKTVELAHA